MKINWRSLIAITGLCAAVCTSFESPLSAADVGDPVDRLKKAIDEDYSYRDLRGVNWDQRFTEFTPKLKAAATPKEFGDVVANLLSPAKDTHLWLKVQGVPVSTTRRMASRNVDVSMLSQRVPKWQKRSSAISSGQFEDGIRYLYIRDWASPDAEYAPAFDVIADAAKAGKPLIVDVRANGGGREPLACEIAGCFVSKPVAYAKNITRRGGKWLAPYTRELKPTADKTPFQGRVAVLAGQGTVSSSESFVMMMKQAGATIVGDRTAGASGNPKPVDLGNGVIVYVPSWKELRLDGTCMEGEGFAPDVQVKVTAADFAKRDPVIDEALRVLRTGK